MGWVERTPRCFQHVAHRPWPLPSRGWRWRQSWHDLLLMHWPVPAPALRALVPAPLNIHKFHGVAWVAVAPFWTSGIEYRLVPSPIRSSMAMLSLHTFVIRNGRPGIWFLQLNAGDRLSAWLGARSLGLPFVATRAHVERGVGMVTHRWERNGEVIFQARYTPVGQAVTPEPGSLEHWLTERYAVYTRGPSGSLRQIELHHGRWPVQQVAATVQRNAVLSGVGLQCHGPLGPVLHTPRLEIVAWPSRQLPTLPKGAGIARRWATPPSTTVATPAEPVSAPGPALPADLPAPAASVPAGV